MDGLPLEPVITTIRTQIETHEEDGSSRDDDDEDGMTGTSVSARASGLTGDLWQWECRDSGE